MSTLYLDHFGLNRSPFKITPELEFFYSGGRRGDLLAALLHVASGDEGIVTVIAEVGSGKTMLSRLLLSQLPAQVSTVYLANPCFSRDEILSAIARDLGLPEQAQSTEAQLARIQQELLRRHAAGQRVLLVIDEAHAMPPESLEEVRLLSNLETESHKLVNIMLFGQPELEAVLDAPRMRQVRDRVIHRFELTPWTDADVAAYIDHRLRAAGWRGGALFSAAAQHLLAQHSDGRARRINVLADKALLAAYASAAQGVEAVHVHSAVRELHNDRPVASRLPVRRVLAAACVLLGVVVVGAWWQRSGGYEGSAHAPHSPAGESPEGRASAASRSTSAWPDQVVGAWPSSAGRTGRVASIASMAPPSAPSSQSPRSPHPTSAAARVTARVMAKPATRPSTAQPLQATPAVEQASALAGVQPTASGVSASGAWAPAALESAVASLPALDGETRGALFTYLQRTAHALAQPGAGAYTVQLASLPRDGKGWKYLAWVPQQLDATQIYAQLSSYSGRGYVSVFWGQYATSAEAQVAIASLPEVFRTNRPLVRTWAKIRQDQEP